jgi:hypothetical protein
MAALPSSPYCYSRYLNLFCEVEKKSVGLGRGGLESRNRFAIRAEIYKPRECLPAVADVREPPVNVHFWGKSGRRDEMALLPLLTLFGHVRRSDW